MPQVFCLIERRKAYPFLCRGCICLCVHMCISKSLLVKLNDCHLVKNNRRAILYLRHLFYQIIIWVLKGY